MADPNRITIDEHAFKPPSRGRPLLIFLAALLFVLAGAYSVWWAWLAGEAQTRLADWIDGQRVEGRDVVIGNVAVSGYPGKIDIRLDDVSISDDAAGWAARLPALRGSFAPWYLNRLDGRFDGPIVVDVVKGPLAGGYRLEADDNEITVDRFSGAAIHLRLSGAKVTPDAINGVMAADVLDVTLRQGAIPVFAAVIVESDGITLPGAVVSPFGQHLERAAFRLDLKGAVPPAGPRAEEVARWRADGGNIDVLDVTIQHGVLGLIGDGTLALDADLQPVGAFTARISGFNAAADQLAQAGIVRRQDAAVAKVVLGVLAKSPPGGGPKQVEAPLTLQDRQLTIGPVSVMRVPPIRWSN